MKSILVWRMTGFRYIGWSLSVFSFILFLLSKPFAIFLNEFGIHIGDKLVTCNMFIWQCMKRSSLNCMLGKCQISECLCYQNIISECYGNFLYHNRLVVTRTKVSQIMRKMTQSFSSTQLKMRIKQTKVLESGNYEVLWHFPY